MPKKLLTMSRQELYELVWSKPVSSLASDFGISDVGFAKRCRAVNVPIPYRGYWARVEAGTAPPKLPLPKYRIPATPPAPAEIPGPEPTVHMDVREPKGDDPVAHSPPRSDGEAQRRAQIDALRIPTTERKARHVGEVALNVSKSVRVRAQQTADLILKACAAIAWPLEVVVQKDERRYHWESDRELPKKASLMVEGEPFFFRIDERIRQVPHELTAVEERDKKLGRLYYTPCIDKVPTGELRLHVLNADGRSSKVITETKSKLLEERIRQTLHAFLDLALEKKRLRAQHERWEAERREKEHLESLARDRREAQQKLIAELERQAGAWHRARLLRRYVHAARKALNGQHIEAKLQNTTVNFLDWATDYIDQLDPLSTRGRNPDQTRTSEYWNSEESIMKETLIRWLGCSATQPSKYHSVGTSMD